MARLAAMAAAVADRLIVAAGLVVAVMVVGAVVAAAAVAAVVGAVVAVAVAVVVVVVTAALTRPATTRTAAPADRETPDKAISLTRIRVTRRPEENPEMDRNDH